MISPATDALFVQLNDAFNTRNADALLNLIDLPLVFVGDQGTKTIDTEMAARQAFELGFSNLESHKVARVCYHPIDEFASSQALNVVLVEFTQTFENGDRTDPQVQYNVVRCGTTSNRMTVIIGPRVFPKRVLN